MECRVMRGLRYVEHPTGEYGPILFASNFLFPEVEEVFGEFEFLLRPGA